MDQKKIDAHLDAVLRASGSALRHYSLQKSRDDMRAAMKAALEEAEAEAEARAVPAEQPVDVRLMGALRGLLSHFAVPSSACRERPAYEEAVAAIAAAEAQQAKPAPLTKAQIERVDEAICEALGMAYDCMRVWEAWRCGTMGPNDFWPVADSHERVAEIRDAALTALGLKKEPQ